MIKKAIEQDTLQALVATCAMREFSAVKRGESWAIQGRIGRSGLPVHPHREPVRTWGSLTAIGGAQIVDSHALQQNFVCSVVRYSGCDEAVVTEQLFLNMT